MISYSNLEECRGFDICLWNPSLYFIKRKFIRNSVPVSHKVKRPADLNATLCSQMTVSPQCYKMTLWLQCNIVLKWRLDLNANSESFLKETWIFGYTSWAWLQLTGDPFPHLKMCQTFLNHRTAQFATGTLEMGKFYSHSLIHLPDSFIQSD